MKHSLLPIGTLMVVSMTSCNYQSFDAQQEQRVITFRTSGFTIETRATLEEAGLTDLWVFDYVDEQLVQQVHQTSDASAFGSPTLSLAHGEHTLRFIASRGTEPSIDDGVLSWTKPHDTFAATLALTVDDETSATQSVTMQRIVAKLQVVVKDALPANIGTIAITTSQRGMAIDIATMATHWPPVGQQIGQAMATPVTQTFAVDDWAGKSDTRYGIYSLITSDEEVTTDVTVTLSDTDGAEIISRDIPNVPLKRNRPTILTGYLFDFDIDAILNISTEWTAEYEQSF